MINKKHGCRVYMHKHANSTHTHTHIRTFTLTLTPPPPPSSTHTHTVPSYHVLEPGKLICIDCLNRDGPIYHELESFHSDSELLDSHAPPIPPRRRAPRQKDPIYERVSSIHRNQAHALRLSMSSEEGSYIAGEWVCGFCLEWKLYIKNTLEPANVCLNSIFEGFNFRCFC